MEISDLIFIGKIGYKVRKDRELEDLVMVIKPDYQSFISKLENIFLIFKDHRVRYGKIDILKLIGENKAIVGIEDEDLLDELKKEENVSVCLDEELINELDESNIYYDPIGMRVIWNEHEVAQITDFFFNGAHWVYEIEMTDHKRVLIPDVEAFVIETNISDRFIKVVDLDQFLAI